MSNLVMRAPSGETMEGEWSWADEILASYPSGIDVSQMDERLKLTPTERLERMLQFSRFLEGARPTGGRRLSAAG